MTAFDLANQWFRRCVFQRYGINGALSMNEDGLAVVFLDVGTEFFMLRGYSYSHLIARMQSLLPELCLRRTALSAIERADIWLERTLTETHRIPVWIGNDEAGVPWALLSCGGERYAIRGYSWMHVIAQVKSLIPELALEDFRLQDEPPEECI